MSTVIYKPAPVRASFSLIEIIIVVILIGIASAIIITNPSKTSAAKINILQLRKILYPDGIYYLFDDGSDFVVKKDENRSGLNIEINFPKVYIYKNGEFVEKDFSEYKNKKIVFEYRVYNGIGESFILHSGNFFYVFKPFQIFKTDNMDRAEELFLNKAYFPAEGEVY